MSETSRPQETTPNRLPLLRALGVYMAIAVVVGNVIGSGIFLKPGNIAADCGDFRIIISVWLAGGVLCLMGALCFAELATMFPHAGGLYVYLRHAYGNMVAFLFGWAEILFSRPASMGALAVAFVGSLTLSLNWNASLLAETLLACLLITFLAWVNIVGVIWGGRVQLLTTIIKVVFLALVAMAPVMSALVIDNPMELSNFASRATPNHNTLAAQIGAVLLAVMWAYNGWHGITPLAEEVKDPGRTIPIALFAGIGMLIVLYLGANLAYHSVLSMEEMRAAGDHAAEQMLNALWGRRGQQAMSIVIMCSTFGAINTNLLQAPRIAFAMGRDGVFFRSLGTVHANYRTPVVSILVTCGMSVALVSTVAVAKVSLRETSTSQMEADLMHRIVDSLHNESMFQLLTNFVIFANSGFYMLAVLALIVLRQRMPNVARPYRTWGYPVVPIAFSVVYIWFLSQIYRSQPLESRAGITLIAIGIPVYFLFRYRSKLLDRSRPA